MKRWVCCGLAVAVLALGLGVSEASAAVIRYRGFVGVRARPVARAAYWGPRAIVAPPVYVAPRRVFVAPPPVYVAPPPAVYYW